MLEKFLTPPTLSERRFFTNDRAAVLCSNLLVGVFVIYALMTVASLALVKSATDVVGDVPSPDGKWDVMLMVRNGGTTTDF